MIEKASVKVGGMSCALCSITIEKGLAKLDGIIKASVSFAAEKVLLEYDKE
ncbi:cation transporter [Bacillota bacterium LX-D]|nr:cation transporter [Bacillota bacterium LX-D]